MIDAKVALLQALVHGDGYGLELIDRVRDLTDGRVRLLQGRVYPILRDLERKGYLTSFEQEASGPGRPRRYYSLTALGRRLARDEATGLARLFQKTRTA